MVKRKQYDSQFKAKVALEALRMRKPLLRLRVSTASIPIRLDSGKSNF